MFKITVPLDDEYSFDFGMVPNKSADKVPISADKVPISVDSLSEQYKRVFNYVRENKKITSHQAELLLNVKQRRAREILGEMTKMGVLKKQGSYKSTMYVINDKIYN